MAAWWIRRNLNCSGSRRLVSLLYHENNYLYSCSLHISTANRISSHQSFQPLSPAVRYLVDTNRVDIALLKPTGPKNRLLKSDILQYLSNKSVDSMVAIKPDKPDHQSVTTFTDIQLTSMRKTIAKRLTESKQSIPYSYSVIDCKMDNMLKLREEMLKQKDVKVSVNDLVIKAVGLSLQRVPECNGKWVNEAIEVFPTVDISIAVATEGGLITPIINRTDTLTITELSSQIRILAKKARAGKLQPHEYQGGSFCVSNLGMYGIREFTAIINPPQAAILAVGGIRSVPWVTDNDEEGVTKIMTVTLSHDCRVIDYELAAKWLSVFKSFLESPSILELL